MRTQSGIAKQMQQAINWSRRRSITNLLFCSFLNDYLYHFHQCQKLKKKRKNRSIQGVTEKSTFILTGNRTHLLQQLF
jgi:CRISPR/Cas system-associated endonuclease Cas3-HD